MKRFFKSFIAFVIVVSSVSFYSIEAKELNTRVFNQNIPTNDSTNFDVILTTIEEVDKFIIKDNQFVLSLPENYVVDKILASEIDSKLLAVNLFVIENKQTIDLMTRSISSTPTISLYGEGWNAFKIYWNYVDIYFSRTTIRNFMMDLGGVLGFASDVLWTLAGLSILNPTLTIVAGWASVISQAFSISLGLTHQYVPFGVNFHADFLVRKVTYIRPL